MPLAAALVNDNVIASDNGDSTALSSSSAAFEKSRREKFAWIDCIVSLAYLKCHFK